MRILCISDTHGLHRQIPDLPEADVIVHAGDFCNRGTFEDCIKALGWFNALPYKHRVIIAGNHDIYMDLEHPDAITWGSNQSAIDAILPKAEGFHYLKESGVEIDGVKFWGSPYQPEFFHWAFNVPRGPAIQECWDRIPADTDVLITHGPAFGILDACPDFSNPGGKYVHVGCANLAKTIKRIKPLAHVCGHVHAGYGHAITDDTLYVNASICNERYSPSNKPILFDLWNDRSTQIVHVY